MRGFRGAAGAERQNERRETVSRWCSAGRGARRRTPSGAARPPVRFPARGGGCEPQSRWKDSSGAGGSGQRRPRLRWTISVGLAPVDANKRGTAGGAALRGNNLFSLGVGGAVVDVIENLSLGQFDIPELGDDGTREHGLPCGTATSYCKKDLVRQARKANGDRFPRPAGQLFHLT